MLMKIITVLYPMLVNPLNHQSIPVMRRILSCIIIIFLSTSINAQQAVTDFGTKEKTTTLFDYGLPLKTTEDNFKNLFRNFPLLISNAGKGIKLLSYKCLTEIKDEKEVKFYLTKNTEVYLSSGGITFGLGENDVEHNTIRMIFLPENQSKQNDASFVKEMDDNIAEMIKNINIGDEVYVVKFLADGKTYDFYVFINSKTKSVIKKGSIFGFDIPLYYADFHSKRKS